jgi:hypothetical protein
MYAKMSSDMKVCGTANSFCTVVHTVLSVERFLAGGSRCAGIA